MGHSKKTGVPANSGKSSYSQQKWETRISRCRGLAEIHENQEKWDIRKNWGYPEVPENHDIRKTSEKIEGTEESQKKHENLEKKDIRKSGEPHNLGKHGHSKKSWVPRKTEKYEIREIGFI